MEEGLKQKIASRGYLKGTITRLLQVCEQDLSSHSIEILEAKRVRLETSFAAYEKLNQEILYLDENDSENVEITESNYFAILTKLDSEIKKKMSTSSMQASKSPHHNLTKLPPVTIQTFNDNSTAKAYQLGRCMEMEPKLEDFLLFIEKQAMALENTEQGHTSSNNNKVVVTHMTTAACGYCAHTEPRRGTSRADGVAHASA
ncbi:uncharacterized protein LOC135071968 [Ostrinia nubilalis]|uniref:uncharacterized protein LOC135071968 n=1 Tax=Ostrinia nubilalis TaxID=29057 RepID=UPI003082332F